MKLIIENIKGDRTLWAVLILLAVFSFLPVYSAASNLAYISESGNTFGFLFKHFVHLSVGFCLIYFVQNIPYEKRALVKDRYRRPLSLIGRNKGDCDSKTVLFLSLMKSAYPSMAVGVVYIKGHAFGMLEMEPKKGDKILRKDGRKYVGVEPVGPRVARIGKLGPKSRRSVAVKRYRIRILE